MLDASIYTAPKIDSHCHILDPQGFAYGTEVAYRPAGQETGSADYFEHVLNAYGVQHALLVGPNSGYSLDNRCMLDAIARGKRRFKGIAVVANDTSTQQLQDLKARGIIGVAFNVALLGLDFYRNIGPLLERLAELGMFAQAQVDSDQMASFAPMLLGSGVQILIDHCGRPDVTQGLNGAGFAAVLGLARSRRATVKLSGFSKFSAQAFPFADTKACIAELLAAFGPDQCVWASDWPFLKAPVRLDYGPLLQLFAQAVPKTEDRQRILWDTPRRIFGFNSG